MSCRRRGICSSIAIRRNINQKHSTSKEPQICGTIAFKKHSAEAKHFRKPGSEAPSLSGKHTAEAQHLRKARICGTIPIRKHIKQEHSISAQQVRKAPEKKNERLHSSAVSACSATQTTASTVSWGQKPVSGTGAVCLTPSQLLMAKHQDKQPLAAVCRCSHWPTCVCCSPGLFSPQASTSSM